MLKEILEKIIGMNKLDSLLARAERDGTSDSIFSNIVEANGNSATLSSRDIEKIPVDGPLIVVANHPSGFAEGLLIPALIDRVRRDQKTLAHCWFSRWSSLAGRMILVDPTAKGAGKYGKATAMKAATRWLREGKSLVMFPAGEVAHARPFSWQAEEQPWKFGLAHLVRLSGATVLPAYFEACNSRFFNFLSWIHPRLGILALNHEFLAKKGQRFVVRIGSPLKGDDFQFIRDPEMIVNLSRQAVEAVGKVSPHSAAGAEVKTREALGHRHDHSTGDKILSVEI